MSHYDSGYRVLRQLVEIRPTSCDWGVFSRSNFAAEDVVGVVAGEVIQGADYCSDYCMELDSQHSLEPHAPFRYLNHSCEPNCQIAGEEILPGDDPHDAQLFIEAIRDIESGDQLTIDYAWPADMAIRCLCKTESCRGWIVDQSEMHQLDAFA